jgi:hypothetical protein
MLFCLSPLLLNIADGIFNIVFDINIQDQILPAKF